MFVQGQEPVQDVYGHDCVVGRSRRFSNASTRSSASYVSCMSPSQSQSRSLLLSPAQSHTSTSFSLYSLGIGIEEAEREERRSKTFWRQKSSGDTLKRQSKDPNHDKSSPQHADGLEGERVNDGTALVRPNTDSMHSVKHTREKDTVRHRSLSARAGSKQGNASDDPVHMGYDRAEKACFFRLGFSRPLMDIVTVCFACDHIYSASRNHHDAVTLRQSACKSERFGYVAELTCGFFLLNLCQQASSVTNLHQWSEIRSLHRLNFYHLPLFPAWKKLQKHC